MKRFLVLTFTLLSLTACGNRNSTNNTEHPTGVTSDRGSDSTTVYVYYFHGEQRCKTCIAVGNVSERTVNDVYADNPRVKFIEVKTHEEPNRPLVEKYEVAWNALIIAKGDNSIEITQQAFANAIKSPEKLADLIKAEVNKRLQ